ncbi:putative chromosome-partitioning protein ParB [Acaryochloris thomasi RCC1774]|uniref:Putative chromosome-partitioning protein ParB n=1 Tax=Acaryochloris thomasi RCC1774 TaxID=1764569 RepID=A0A2W1J7N4_9CYAN|nr:ParB/RepB/Spo0J family partition protein [Acaryochloris thomasi]PZD70469.1 putative chromosome-partitioning protein ParB [Acaryochloris thomasi RCC1774]
MATTNRPKVSSFLSTSSKALETQKDLDNARQQISQLEKDLADSEKYLEELVGKNNLSQAVVSISEIQRRPYQSRVERDEEAFNDLVASIKSFGFLGSIWVQRLKDRTLRLIAGETRLDAATAAGLTEIKVDIAEVDDVTAVKLSRVENTRRRSLNALDDTEELLYLLTLVLGKTKKETIRSLYRYKNAAEGKAKIDQGIKSLIESTFIEAAPELGVKTFVTSRLPLLELPTEVLAAYNSGKIEYTKAIFLGRIEDPKLRASLLHEAVSNKLSLAALKKKAKPTVQTNAVDSITKLHSRIDSIGSKQISKLSKRQKTKFKKSILELEKKLQDILAELDE